MEYALPNLNTPHKTIHIGAVRIISILGGKLSWETDIGCSKLPRAGFSEDVGPVLDQVLDGSFHAHNCIYTHLGVAGQCPAQPLALI